MFQRSQEENTAAPFAAIDDPVPASAESCLYGTDYEACHSVERDVQRALLSISQLEFSSLQIRRIPGGICLTGCVRGDEKSLQMIEEVVTEVACTTAMRNDTVLNYLVVQKRESCQMVDAKPLAAIGLDEMFDLIEGELTRQQQSPVRKK